MTNENSEIKKMIDGLRDDFVEWAVGHRLGMVEQECRDRWSDDWIADPVSEIYEYAQNYGIAEDLTEEQFEEIWYGGDDPDDVVKEVIDMYWNFDLSNIGYEGMVREWLVYDLKTLLEYARWWDYPDMEAVELVELATLDMRMAA